MREKLIELMCEAKWTAPETDSWTEYLADYLLANSVVVLPCKVGDIVYFVNRVFGEVLEATVICVEFNYYTKPKVWITVEYISSHTGIQKYKSRSDLMFGKLIFLTKEEAEAALERRK